MKRTILLIFIGMIAAQDSVLRESFDASALKPKDPDWPAVMDPLIKNKVELNRVLGLDSTQLIREGFRVQVFASGQKEKADSLKYHLETIVDDAVFVTFEVPLYKVRVGNCISRKEAERLQARLNEIGYRNAWIIKSRIEPQKPY